MDLTLNTALPFFGLGLCTFIYAAYIIISYDRKYYGDNNDK